MVDPGRCFVEAVLEGEIDCPVELVEAGADPSQSLGLAELHERRGHQLVVAELLACFERECGPLRGGLVVARGAPEVREIAVGAAELAARAERLEQLDGVHAGLERFVDVAGAPEVVRADPERAALGVAVTRRPVALDRLAERSERLRVLVGDVHEYARRSSRSPRSRRRHFAAAPNARAN